MEEELVLGLPVLCQARRWLSMRSLAFSPHPSHVCAVRMFLILYWYLTSSNCNLSLIHLLWFFDERVDILFHFGSCALAHRACSLCLRNRKLPAKLGASSWNSCFT